MWLRLKSAFVCKTSQPKIEYVDCGFDKKGLESKKFLFFSENPLSNMFFNFIVAT